MGALTVLINAGPWLPVPPVGYGGIENIVATLIPQLRRHGVRVVLATVGRSTIEVDEQITVFDEPQFAHLSEPYNDVVGIAAAHMQRIADEVRCRSDIDLVHDHMEVAGPSVLSSLGADRPPVLHTLHWDLAKHRAFYGNFDGRGRFGVNGVSAAQMCRAPERLSAHSVGHVHLATPLADGAHRRPLPDKDDHLVLVARITPNKGQHIAARLAQRRGWRLVFAGPVGPYPTLERIEADPNADRYGDVRYWREAVAPHVDGDRVRWIGSATGSERDDVVATARATLFPVCWEEPGGTAVIESLALGTPVVGFRRGCLPELIEPGTGSLAEFGDEATLAQLISEVDRIDPVRCREAAERRFTPAVMAAAYLKLYDRCVAGTHPRRTACLPTVASTATG
ncbi:glycosyltransferase [Mycobacterium sp. NAZ190054]|uniref:glycosyltransferase n=1 Tax=Mycobacterium sp. NAZ190054 TaxID=1747766 RepID=UPI000795BE75|nr:glycosyltransferase [Mycobacterium sp. NAZ190054]KWX67772.1 glycosyl transferase family 1 [Mycobacterium sp. NAZ190054]